MRAGLLVVVALVLVPGVVRAEDRAPFKLKYAVAEDVEGGAVSQQVVADDDVEAPIGKRQRRSRFDDDLPV